MYLLFRLHHWKPSDYNDLGFGAKQVVRAFLHQEIDDKRKEIESINKRK